MSIHLQNYSADSRIFLKKVAKIFDYFSNVSDIIPFKKIVLLLLVETDVFGLLNSTRDDQSM